MLIYPIFIPHRGCPQSCIYCDQYQVTGVTNADWNILLFQLRRFCNYHQDEEKEIAFYGGSFTCLSKYMQNEMYDSVSPFLDERTFLRYSTRPDGITEEILQDSYLHGVRTVELGIQDFNDHVLQKSQRGYSRQEAMDACRLVKSNGLKLSIQLMPGLPGYDSSMLAGTIEDTLSLQPDYVRIYPTLVIAGTPLEKMYRNGEYIPLSLEDALNDTARMVEEFESSGIHVIKIGLTGMERSNVIAGPFHSSFGELTRSEIYLRRILERHDPNQVLHVSNKDVSLLLGHKKEYLTRIKYLFNQSAIKISVSDLLKKGEFLYSQDEEFVLW